MKQIKLTHDELNILLLHYQKQLADAEQQLQEAADEVDRIKGKIAELNVSNGLTTAKPATKPVRKSPVETVKAAPKRPAKVTQKAAPKVERELPLVEMRPAENGAPFAALSMTQKEWRDIIMEILGETNKPLTNKQIFEHAKSNLDLEEDEFKRVKSTIGQALNTLANKKNEVFKHKKLGERGFYYCLPEWYSKQGNLKKGYVKMIK